MIDTASNGVAHEIEIPGKPFQVAFSRNFAFIRALETNRVSMINLSSLKASDPPPVLGFDAGERAPETAPNLLPSDLFAPAVTEAAMLAVSPGDATVYYLHGRHECADGELPELRSPSVIGHGCGSHDQRTGAGHLSVSAKTAITRQFPGFDDPGRPPADRVF